MTSVQSLLQQSINQSINQPINQSINQTDLLSKFAKYKIDPVDLKVLLKNDIEIDCLMHLTEESLYRMGIQSFGKRIKILQAAADILKESINQSINQSNKQSIDQSKKVKADRPRTADNQSNNQSIKSKTLDRPLNDKKRSTDRLTINQTDSEDDHRSIKQSNKQSNTRRVPLSDSEQSDDDYQSDQSDDQSNNRSTKQSNNRSNNQSNNQLDDEDDDLFGTVDAGVGSEFMAVKPWLGAIVPPSKQPKLDPSPPDQRLSLEWIHGYRSFDCRSNLFNNQSNELIYPVAGAIVVYNSDTKKQRHFLGHNDDVTCLARHPTNHNLFVSGQNATIVKGKGNPPCVIVWDSTDFTKLYTLKFNQEDRSIASVSFSGDGTQVITVSNDDNHTIKLWNWEKQKMLASVKGDTNIIWQIAGNHRDASEFVSVGKRHAVFWRWDNGKLTGKRAQVSDRALSFHSVCFSEKGYACLGGEDGSIYVYVGGRPVKTFTNVHQGKVLTLGSYAGGLVSGGSDGVVHVLDKKMEVRQRFEIDSKAVAVHLNESNDSLLIGTGKSEVYEVKNYTRFDQSTSQSLNQTLQPITTGHHDGELWALTTSSDGRTFVTVGEDNMIAVWDLVTHKCLRRAKINEKKGVKPKVLRASTTSTHPTNQCARAASLSPNTAHLAIGLNTGEVAIYDYATLSVIACIDLNSHGKRAVTNQKDNWIQALSFSPNGRVLAVGTHGSVVCLLDVNKDYRVGGLCKGSNSFISHLDWNVDGSVLQTNDGAYELLFYAVDSSNLSATKQITSATSVRDEKWASITCTLGWGVQGIYDPSQNGQDVNSVDVFPVSGSNQLAVTGDDHGAVNLYRYPVPKGANKTCARAHSSHVVTTRFTNDGRYVLSSGGHDKAICQWKVLG